MNKLTIIEDKRTGRRSIFDSLEDAKTFIESCTEGIKFITFDEMTDSEKYILLYSEFIKAKSFDDSARGTGRTYDSSLRISVGQMKWLMDKIKPLIDFSELDER